LVAYFSKFASVHFLKTPQRDSLASICRTKAFRRLAISPTKCVAFLNPHANVIVCRMNGGATGGGTLKHHKRFLSKQSRSILSGRLAQGDGPK
jgi:hypothetical protein